MPSDIDYDPHTFHVESNFQKMARRAGGVPRQQALDNAQIALEKIQMGFSEWLDNEIEGLLAQIKIGRTAPPEDFAWAEQALVHARQIRDVGSTMGYELVTFIAANLCEIFEGIIAGANHRSDMIDCHVDALLLAKQEQYRHLRPDQLPELSTGLRRVLEVAHLAPDTPGEK